MRAWVRTSITGALTVAMVALVGLAPATAASTPPGQNANWQGPNTGTTATRPCADVLFIGARGSGERAWDDVDEGYGRMVREVLDGLKAALLPSITAREVAVWYPALPTEQIGADVLNAQNKYLDGMLLGVQETWTIMMDSYARCPGEQIILAGYSQGAGVMHRVLVDFPHVDKVAGVVLIADPARDSDYKSATFNGYASRQSGLLGVADLEMGPVQQQYRDLTIEFCKTNDPICDLGNRDEIYPNLIGIAARVNNDIAIHGTYKTAALTSAGRIMALKLNNKFPPTPLIEGLGYPNTALSVNTAAWKKGAVPLEYQWYASGAPVTGANGRTWTLPWDLHWRDISVRVTAPGSTYPVKTAHSFSFRPGLPQPALTGSGRLGSTITAKVGTWSPAPYFYGHDWYRSDGPPDVSMVRDPVPESTGSRTHVVTKADLGRTLLFCTRVTNGDKSMPGGGGYQFGVACGHFSVPSAP